MKKKIISFALIFIMILGVLPIKAFAISVPLSIKLIEQQNFQNSKDAEFSFEVENKSDKEITAYLLTALYQKNNNKMISYNYLKKEISPNESVEWGTMFVIPESEEYYLKAFAWDSMLKPSVLSNILNVNMGNNNDVPFTYKKALKSVNDYIKLEVNNPVISSVGGEWAVLGLARNEFEQLEQSYKDNYYDKVEAEVVAQKNNSRPWSLKVTEVERVILALSAIGKDPSNIENVNLYNYIWNKEINMPNSGELGDRQGVNELIFGLLAVDALPDVNIPTDSAINRDEIITKISKYQMSDGGFSLSDENKSFDADLTGMTITALAKYYENNSTAKAMLDKAIDKLEKVQTENGGFIGSLAGENCESLEALAQVIVGLSAMGIDADTDSRFIKNDISVLDAMLAYYDKETGGFKHVVDGDVSVMASEQALYALTAYDRLKKGKNALYDMSDVNMQSEPIGKVKMSIEKRVIGKGDTLSLIEVDLYKGETVWDVFQRVCEGKNIPYQHRGDISNHSIYIESIDNDGEFDYGDGSGWQYEVNGEFPDVGVCATSLKPNDKVRFRYCLSFAAPELKAPLVNYLKNKLLVESEEYLNGDFTNESKVDLQTAIKEAEKIAYDEHYNTEDADEELIVSEHIGNILKAIAALEVEKVDPSIPTDFDNDLWVKYDFAEMKVGETKYFQGRRVPMVIGFIPNFNFEIIQGDSVSIDIQQNEDEGSGSYGNNTSFIATAEKEGVTIVKVTYDEGFYRGKNYSCSSPVNAAYVVFSVVGEEDKSIEITDNIAYDTYDTVYFTNDYAELPFTVTTEQGATIEVTCNGKVVVKSNGEYVAQLENRANIIGIKVTDTEGNTRTKYKVIDARKIKVNIKNVSRPGEKIGVNDKVNISFVGITMPVYKLETIYNPTSIEIGSMFDEDVKGTYVEYAYQGKIYKGLCNQYNLATNNDFDITFTEEGEQTLSGGRIYCSWWGEKLGKDKGLDAGVEPNLNAPVYSRYFSYLPDITVNVGAFVDVKVDNIAFSKENLTMEMGETTSLIATVGPDIARNKEVEWSSSNKEIASVDQSGKITAVKEGDAIITATAKDGGGAFSTCAITIIPEAPATAEEKTNLGTLLQEVKNWERTDTYTDELWNKFTEVRITAQNIFDKKDALLVQVNDAYEVLNDAKENLLASDEEKQELIQKLERLINDCNKEKQDRYPNNFKYWAEFVEKLEEAKTLLNGNIATVSEIKEITLQLKIAKNALSTIVYDLTQYKTAAGMKVTINFKNLTLPSSGSYMIEWCTKYDSNIPGMQTIQTENCKDNRELLKTLSFVVPTGLEGEFVLKNGRIFGHHGIIPGFGVEKKDYLKDKMPEISFIINDNDGIVSSTPTIGALSFEKNEVFLSEGETKQLNVIVEPEDVTNPDLQWVSSDENVAAVASNGVVTANTTGSAIIVVSAADNEDIKSSCSVTVKKKALQGEAYTVNKTENGDNTNIVVTLDFNRLGIDPIVIKDYSSGLKLIYTCDMSDNDNKQVKSKEARYNIEELKILKFFIPNTTKTVTLKGGYIEAKYYPDSSTWVPTVEKYFKSKLPDIIINVADTQQ